MNDPEIRLCAAFIYGDIVLMQKAGKPGKEIIVSVYSALKNFAIEQRKDINDSASNRNN